MKPLLNTVHVTCKYDRIKNVNSTNESYSGASLHKVNRIRKSKKKKKNCLRSMLSTSSTVLKIRFPSWLEIWWASSGIKNSRLQIFATRETGTVVTLI
jgi:hypothetical protein